MKILKKNIIHNVMHPVMHNVMRGGSTNEMSQTRQIQLFFAIIILGYFGIKIAYGLFFGYYPQKYYNRNVNIITTANNTTNTKDAIANEKSITLNAYVPGIWNNEMTDFISMIVIAFIIYIFTNVSTTSILNEYGNLSMAFLFGYIIGLGYPPIYTNYLNYYYQETDRSPILKYMYLTISITVILGVFLINYQTANNLGRSYQINYIIYTVVLTLLFFGLYFSRKNDKTYGTISYFNSNGTTCLSQKDGFVRGSEDKLNITVPFVAFIVILLFSYEPISLPMKNLYGFLYGLFLGIIVSGISYFGLEYFLSKEPEKHCNTLRECVDKENENNGDYSNLQLPDIDLKTPNIPHIDLNINRPTNIFKEYNVSILNVILLMFIILIAIYLFWGKVVPKITSFFSSF